MTLEFLLWLIAWFVVSEIFFIIGYVNWIDKFDWLKWKIFSFLIGAFFMLIQAAIVSSDKTGNFTNSNYIYLLYEFIIILGITAFFGLNKLIVLLIDNVDKKKGGKNKKRK